jgi:ATP-dependent Clp endopeptidase proteolytic subunit ClpP
MANELRDLHPIEVERIEREIELIELKKQETAITVKQRERAVLEAEAGAWHNQIFELTGAINSLTVSTAIDAIGTWSRMNPGSDITIVFTSPGGSVFDGLALYDFIQDLKERGHKVTTVARGWVASMAGVLLQAGTERVMAPNSYLMIHEPLRVAFLEVIKASDMKDDALLFERLWNKCIEILGERSTMTNRQIKTKSSRRDWWLDPADAVELGFADRVGYE